MVMPWKGFRFVFAFGTACGIIMLSVATDTTISRGLGRHSVYLSKMSKAQHLMLSIETLAMCGRNIFYLPGSKFPFPCCFPQQQPQVAGLSCSWTWRRNCQTACLGFWMAQGCRSTNHINLKVLSSFYLKIKYVYKLSGCVKIGFLPNGQVLVRARDKRQTL